MHWFYEQVTFIFDPLHAFWESDRTQRFVAGTLVVIFLAALGIIEFNRRGMLPSSLTRMVPYSHFYAVYLAFYLVLILEVISLIFTLPCSFSKSVGKQFEILSLILLRNSFKELVHFPEPLTLTGSMLPTWNIIASAFGAMAIFALLGLYYRLQKPQKSKKSKHRAELLYAFVATKKAVSLSMLLLFLGLGLNNMYLAARGLPHEDFFHHFYTLLVFSDILLVLISQHYLPQFHSVFRNSGFALATLLIRLALAAPPFYNVALGLSSILFAICMTLAFNYATEVKKGG